MTQCQVMLQMLISAGAYGVTSREFVEGANTDHRQIFKYTNRISDLRRAGHVIKAERVKDSLYRYYLEAARPDRKSIEIKTEETGQVGFI